MSKVTVRRLLGGVVALAVLGPLFPGVAEAEPVPAKETAFEEDFAVLEVEGVAGNVVKVTAYNTENQIIDVPLSFQSKQPEKYVPWTTVTAAPDNSTLDGTKSGTAGSSSARGCATMYVYNTKRTMLGAKAYVYVTTTHWCWDRPTGWINGIFRSEYVTDKSAFIRLGDRVEGWTQVGFYPWRQEYKRSGYRHFRARKFENCIAKYGCISTSIANNRMWLHSNGTVVWWTNV